MKTQNTVTINADQSLFVIHCQGGGYSCLGFDVLEKRAGALAKELADLSLPIPPEAMAGTIERFNQYSALVDMARELNAKTGWRSKSELHPQLVGLEGRRVLVVTEDGEKLRFQVGKSTGFIPCHLMIARRNCSGGMAVFSGTFKSVSVLN